MTSTEFAERWLREFPRARPLGWQVRTAYATRWLRLYTLPEGKRPPEGPAELAEVLRRIEAVAEDVIGEGETVEIVVPSSGPAHDPSTLPTDFRTLDPSPLLPVPGPADLEGETTPPLWHASAVWSPGLLAQTFSEVAEGSRGSVLLFGPCRDEVVSPYEGGVDVIGHDETLRGLRMRRRTWLSNRRDGL